MTAVAAHVWVVPAPLSDPGTAHGTGAQPVEQLEPAPPAEPNIRLDTRTILIRPEPGLRLRKAEHTTTVDAATLLMRRTALDTPVVDVAVGTTADSVAEREIVPTAVLAPPTAAREAEPLQTFAAVTPPPIPAPLPALARRLMPVMAPPATLARMPAEQPRVAPLAEPLPPGRAADQLTQKEMVLDLLRRYAHAYERMDVPAAKALYPSLDDRALQQRFNGLNGQQMSLADCGVSFVGRGANARCQTSATYRPKVGRAQRHNGLEWTFNLSLDDAGWQIVDARMQ